MQLKLGIKSDPIQYRYSHPWLFALLDELNVRYVQIGSFFELYSVEDGYFFDLRREAEKKNIQIKSCFTTHRELGGFLSGNHYLEKAARLNYERYIHVAALLGADYMGSSAGTVLRDTMAYKKTGTDCYIRHMKELSVVAKKAGLKALTMEPMSSSNEPPTFPAEYDYMLKELARYHEVNPEDTVPVYLCGDISHGAADENRRVLHSNLELFEYGIPNMAEFHFKNTDSIYNSTFGFSEEERERGIVDVDEVLSIVWKRADDWPVDEVVGYYETGGPKMGRDYSDLLLRDQLTESLLYLQERIEIFEAKKDALKVRHESSARRFAIRLGEKIAYLTYKEIEDGTLNFNSTYVPPEYRDQGIASVLTKEALNWARNNGYMVMPSCSYVVDYMKEHPEYRDLLE